MVADMVNKQTFCAHSTLLLSESPHASEAGFQRRSEQQRATAAGKKKNDSSADAASFPGPLVLPEDDLSSDPKQPAQSLRSFLSNKHRNKVTPEKNVIYVAAPPIISKEVHFISSWSYPERHKDDLNLTTPKTQDVVDYLAAFYHGLPVRMLSAPPLHFTSWETSNPKGSRSRAKARLSVDDTSSIGLKTSSEIIRIRTRPTPAGLFSNQLNLDDLLDVAMSILPEDAYALLLLVEHDIFESPDDDFACGRAYGGSRVAVVSTARYDPNLDARQNVEREHAWPASHCQAYVQACCEKASDAAPRPKKKVKVGSGAAAAKTVPFDHSLQQMKPMQAAVCYYTACFKARQSPHLIAFHLSWLWFARVCRTTSHELGHCFGIGHCVYYACVMQSTASLAEDARQPMYLCPVDLTKLVEATGVDVEERYEAMIAFCERFQTTSVFAAFLAWLRRLRDGGGMLA